MNGLGGIFVLRLNIYVCPKQVGKYAYTLDFEVIFSQKLPLTL